MPGEMVSFPSNGAQASGYLSSPKDGNGPGVVVIQEWWGLVPHIRKVADRLAGEGFLALAPDLYHGRSTRSPDEAGKLMMAMNIEKAGREIGAAISHLKSHPRNSSRKAATVGFCMGGALSLYAASTNAAVDACVVFYGGHPNVKPDLSALSAPLLGLYGEEDDFVTIHSVRELESRLKQLGKSYEFHIYPGAQHAFFNDERPEVYSKPAADDAWNRTLEFLRTHLA